MENFKLFTVLDRMAKSQDNNFINKTYFTFIKEVELYVKGKTDYYEAYCHLSFIKIELSSMFEVQESANFFSNL